MGCNAGFVRENCFEVLIFGDGVDFVFLRTSVV
jgi:hypothetical protein